MGILFLGAMGFAIRTILARRLATVGRRTTLQITTISMGFGSLALLLLALRTGPRPALALKSLLIITLLSGVHTALPFTLWTHVLRALQAFPAGVISNTTMVQIAILAWIFLGEGLSEREISAIAVVLFGVFLIQGGEIIKKALKPPGLEF